jgi:hypothetical protein
MSSVLHEAFKHWKQPAVIAPSLLEIWPIKTPVVKWPPQKKLRNDQIAYLGDDMITRAMRHAIRDPDSK